MPGKCVAGSNELCRRCKDNASVIVVRFEPLCQECFHRYVHTKCIKRLESFRVSFAVVHQRKVLLPLSFGISSVTLLHILDLHLKTQRSKTGRTGFTISAVFVDGPEQDGNVEELLHGAQSLYPDHEYISLPLHDVFRVLPDDAAIRDLVTSDDKPNGSSPREQLAQLYNVLPSATARSDVLTTLRTRLIVEHARMTGCECVLWGDSTTRLAEKTLAETAKGRGFSLPWHIDDGDSPFGLKFHYPLRDVLKTELASYMNMADAGLATLVHETSSSVTPGSLSSKNTTIDDLMKQYFVSVEKNFPSIVANVVRTTSKLKLPSNASSDPTCSLCSMPVPHGRFGIHGWGGEQQGRAAISTTDGSKSICYGCTRSLP